MSISPQVAFDNLKFVDRVDASTSADYRESAIDILADPEVSLDWRSAIADRLNAANLELTLHSVDDAVEEESY
jgi:hypothetical protein